MDRVARLCDDRHLGALPGQRGDQLVHVAGHAGPVGRQRSGIDEHPQVGSLPERAASAHAQPGKRAWARRSYSRLLARLTAS